ncbi:hypothetical protein CSV71_02410 [Sporosarcina sp. P21c]|uniref:hypothetical protein n=1 Tax=Sporosarcina sp. P21c TaxID=2048255 RepID=UPI000C168433|nr:hypothetical protein [Sporosarcina sp. P21c]PIC90929.1 hypothetical protein CSV71_02410 [Sporosarcina sp. P21c]
MGCYRQLALFKGYDFNESREPFNTSLKYILESGGPNNEFVHSILFFLVNPDGEVVGKYDGMSGDEMKVIIEDMKVVLE